MVRMVRLDGCGSSTAQGTGYSSGSVYKGLGFYVSLCSICSHFGGDSIRMKMHMTTIRSHSTVALDLVQ